jgi:quinol monooxygenase YgiN
MILITGRVVIRGEDREAFLKSAITQVNNSRAEEGCLFYSCNEDVMAPNAFLFVEHWKDPEAVKIHFGKDYCGAFMRDMKRLAQNRPAIAMHHVSRTEVRQPGGE